MRGERVRDVRELDVSDLQRILKKSVMTNAEFNEILRERTKDFAVKILKFLADVPYNASTKILTYQLGKSATSVGASFRAFAEGDQKMKSFPKYASW